MAPVLLIVIVFVLVGGGNLLLYRHRATRFKIAVQLLRSSGREPSDADELLEVEFLSSDNSDAMFVFFAWWVHFPVNVYKYVKETFRIWDIQDYARSCKNMKVLNEP